MLFVCSLLNIITLTFMFILSYIPLRVVKNVIFKMVNFTTVKPEVKKFSLIKIKEFDILLAKYLMIVLYMILMQNMEISFLKFFNTNFSQYGKSSCNI